MSTHITTINGFGVEGKDDLDFTQFWGGKASGIMLQLTQGFGGLPGFEGEPGYIQLTVRDARAIIKILQCWVREIEGDKVEKD